MNFNLCFTISCLQTELASKFQLLYPLPKIGDVEDKRVIRELVWRLCYKSDLICQMSQCQNLIGFEKKMLKSCLYQDKRWLLGARLGRRALIINCRR